MKDYLFIRPEAEVDIRGAFGWYEDRVAGLGKNFIRCVDTVFSKINRRPESYPIIYKNVRRALTRRFPFGVFYIISQEKVIIIAVLHARREPSMWQKRKVR